MAEAHDGLYVIDDDPPLGQAIESQGVSVSFADSSELQALAFYGAVGVRNLSTVCRPIGSAEIGDERPPPKWYNTSRIVGRINSCEFASALETLLAYELRGKLDEQRLKPQLIRQRLQEMQRIVFVESIAVKYEVNGHRVWVPREYSLEDQVLALVWVHSSSELHGRLARAIADLVSDGVGLPHHLEDAIFRLLVSRSARETRGYLEGRGIPWLPPGDKTKDVEEDDEEQETEDLDEESPEYASLLEALTQWASAQGSDHGAHEHDKAEATETESQEATGNTDGAAKPRRSLPPIDLQEVNVSETCDSFTPKGRERGMRSGRESWQPPSPQDEEWEREIGKRGEELVYRKELARVRDLGLPESRVKWVSAEDPGADHDILSVDDDGADLWIEVKSTTGRDGRFKWPRSEFEKAVDKRARYVLCRVYEVDKNRVTMKRFRDPVGMLPTHAMRLDIESLSAEVEPMSA